MRIRDLVLLVACVPISQVIPADSQTGTREEPRVWVKPNIYVDSEIRRGAHQQFVETLRAIKSLPGWDSPIRVILDSPGGDVIEAMKIGETIRQHKLITDFPMSSTRCEQRLFLHLGRRRAASDGARFQEGIWRSSPHFDPKYFSALNVDDAKRRYETMSAEAQTYLVRMDVPQGLIDRAWATPSEKVLRWSSLKDDSFTAVLPYFSEWLTAQCDKRTPQQRSDHDTVSRYEASKSSWA
jgi:hypothetical protein